jgi:hypothetical protein
VVNQQLITLFGGVDTGTVNAYALNFAAPYSTLANGIVIYFVGSNTNTGPSTLTVNGLGTIPILNQNGAVLGAGQIIAGGATGVMYYNGNWIIITSANSVPTTGSFSAAVTGGSNAPLTCAYSIVGSNVNVNLPYCAFTSTVVTFTLTGLPAALQPASNKLVPLAIMQNNGAYVTTASAGLASANPGVITFYLAGSPGGWTASGIKGIGYFAFVGNGVTLAYNLL